MLFLDDARCRRENPECCLSLGVVWSLAQYKESLQELRPILSWLISVMIGQPGLTTPILHHHY